jgi:hypothetical protein
VFAIRDADGGCGLNRRQREHVLESGLSIDCAFPDALLAIEADGPLHFFCKKNAAFCDAIFMLKMIILPRQARDKHRENSKRDMRFLIGNEPDRPLAKTALKHYLLRDQVRKTPFRKPF